MKKYGVILLTLLVLILGVASGAGAQDKKTYIVGIDGDYYPFSYIDENGNPAGFDVESIKWIAQEMGFEVKIVPIAWDGIIPALLAKKIDMIYSGMTVTEERKEKVDFTDVYWVVNQAIATKEEANWTLEDFLAGKCSVGTQRGCSAAMWVEDNLVKTGVLTEDKLKLYDNFPLAVTDLLNGRVETVIMDEPVISKAIAGKPLKTIGVISTGEEYAIAVRKEDTELKALLNEGLKRLMSSPYWEELIEKYEMK
ncbi:MAG: polar amino acid transport system substrate-binding protein [Candidatus Atribacteria bacterium]|nr:polar amino acid transport system substrate-binding protein [Candidatus Atribacteria bacterium]